MCPCTYTTCEIGYVKFIPLMLYYMVFMHHGMTKGISSKTQFGVSASIKHFHRLWKKLSRHLSSPWYFTGLAISAQFPLKHSTCSFFSCVSLRSQENAESPPPNARFSQVLGLLFSRPRARVLGLKSMLVP